MKEIYIFGGSGHAKVIIEIAELNGYEIKGIIADDISKDLHNYPSLSQEDFFAIKAMKSAVIAIGNNSIREKFFYKLKDKDINLPSLIHPTAIISSKAMIKEGTVVMAGAIVNPYTKVGFGSIINTGAVIDHDGNIEEFCHIAPNCSISGTVSIGKKTFLGVGSTIINNITIGSNIIVGGGSVVVKDLLESKTYKGNPAK